MFPIVIPRKFTPRLTFLAVLKTIGDIKVFGSATPKVPLGVPSWVKNFGLPNSVFARCTLFNGLDLWQIVENKVW